MMWWRHVSYIVRLVVLLLCYVLIKSLVICFSDLCRLWINTWYESYSYWPLYSHPYYIITSMIFVLRPRNTNPPLALHNMKHWRVFSFVIRLTPESEVFALRDYNTYYVYWGSQYNQPHRRGFVLRYRNTYYVYCVYCEYKGPIQGSSNTIRITYWSYICGGSHIHLGKCSDAMDIERTHRRCTFVASLDLRRDEWVSRHDTTFIFHPHSAMTWHFECSEF